mmetsp:Transcript_11233/g.35662  ORF Transcript_11233/g.35662 Transcript_11233/m.35662 type:complete len:258 (+) Transcript_11233:536-1309(+)
MVVPASSHNHLGRDGLSACGANSLVCGERRGSSRCCLLLGSEASGSLARLDRFALCRSTPRRLALRRLDACSLRICRSLGRSSLGLLPISRGLGSSLRVGGLTSLFLLSSEPLGFLSRTGSSCCRCCRTLLLSLLGCTTLLFFLGSQTGSLLLRNGGCALRRCLGFGLGLRLNLRLGSRIGYRSIHGDTFSGATTKAGRSTSAGSSTRSATTSATTSAAQRATATALPSTSHATIAGTYCHTSANPSTGRLQLHLAK